MNDVKRRRLESNGWRVGSAKDFLELSDGESEYIELKLKLAESLRSKRLARKLGQMALAKMVGSSQSRVAKMEAADDSVSIDLLIRSLLKLGVLNPEIGRMIAKAKGPDRREGPRRSSRTRQGAGNVSGPSIV